MPTPTMFFEYELNNTLIKDKENYDIEELTQIINNGLPQLNVDQYAIFESIVKAIETHASAIMFVDGPASSGMAALLLPGGRTAHSCFKIPINVHEDSTCTVSYEEHMPFVTNSKANTIKLPEYIVLRSQELNDMIHYIYPNLSNCLDYQYMVEHSIFASKNNDISIINSTVMTQFPKEAIEYLSADSIVEQRETNYQYPIEFLNSLNFGGLSSYKLILKLGTLIILLWNIHPPNGLYNRTRLICCNFQKHVIKAKIITEKHFGKHVFLPYITMSPSNSDLPFVLKCHQFLVHLAFAITINKSQRQTLNFVVLAIEQDKEAIGQTRFTFNIVYPEIFQ
ncbi:5255_t:CDS:2 [Cetraspora pellucida]|uniref:ATP-dependent DNA helicase n=1 Tax=Cetraspora pellucida TaxID=1433469 RepID=A0A9N9ELU4_9GLOM|nr:5255_t:CDS:2 [Cetraspora pellucida]